MAKKPKKTTQKSAASVGTMTDDDWPIGLLPDSTLNVVDPGDPCFRPTVIKDSRASGLRSREVAGANDPDDIDLKSLWRELIAEVHRLQAQAISGGAN